MHGQGGRRSHGLTANGRHPKRRERATETREQTSGQERQQTNGRNPERGHPHPAREANGHFFIETPFDLKKPARLKAKKPRGSARPVTGRPERSVGGSASDLDGDAHAGLKSLSCRAGFCT